MDAERRSNRARRAWIGLTALCAALLLLGPAPDARAGDVKFRLSIGSGHHYKPYHHGFHGRHGGLHKGHRYHYRKYSPFRYHNRHSYSHRYHSGSRYNLHGRHGLHGRYERSSGLRYHYTVPLIRDPHVGLRHRTTYHATARLHDPHNVYSRQYILRPGEAVRPGDPTAARVITREGRIGGAELTTYDTTTPRLADVRDVSGEEGPGWSALLAGEGRDAMKAFAIEAERHPQRGLPKVGFALAAAMAGDHDRAYWAMRRALRYDADALAQAPLDPALREQLYDWATEQAERAEQQRNGGAAFMAAAYAYLAGEHEEARRYADLADRYGHEGSSVAALKRVLD